MSDGYIEIFITNKSNEISIEEKGYINHYLPFYAHIPNDDLAYLFAFFHYKFNKLFQFMNNKIRTINHHYNASESRDLISIIDDEVQLFKELKNSKYDFDIVDEYLQAINICDTFLVVSGGSHIPEDFKKIDIIEAKPIFNLKHLNVNDGISMPTTKINTKEKNMSKMNKKVFIVHGHDNETKHEVARYIESIGLESIILHEQANTGMTIIEKIEYYTNESNFAIVLYTPCDKGRGVLETKVEARYRARQNVVFEHGYLMAKIGRKNVCALVKGEIETPSDISGVVYTQLDLAGGWKNQLNKELKACGYNLSQL